jgi:hypothetical protein
MRRYKPAYAAGSLATLPKHEAACGSACRDGLFVGIGKNNERVSSIRPTVSKDALDPRERRRAAEVGGDEAKRLDARRRQNTKAHQQSQRRQQDFECWRHRQMGRNSADRAIRRKPGLGGFPRPRRRRRRLAAQTAAEVGYAVNRRRARQRDGAAAMAGNDDVQEDELEHQQRNAESPSNDGANAEVGALSKPDVRSLASST